GALPKSQLFGIIVFNIIVWLGAVFMISAWPASAFASETAQHKRVVSIGGSLTEIIFALGVQDRLVARDTTSVFPQEAFSLPDVGYIRQLSPEGVLSVNPDLILALEGAGPPETIQALKNANVPLVFIPEGYDAAKIIEKIETIGAALGVKDRAKQLVEKINTDLNDLATKNDNAASEQKVLFILSMQGGKILAGGKDTAADGIIRLSGARNIIDQFSGYRQIDDESVIAAQPDVILMMNPRGNHNISDKDVFAHPSIATTPAGKNRKIVRMDGLYMLGFGPRTAKAAADLNREIYLKIDD
ncbi:MAG: hemin ABC transporter substrate-binding protein, partial [Pseudomonadota bacterium]